MFPYAGAAREILNRFLSRNRAKFPAFEKRSILRNFEERDSDSVAFGGQDDSIVKGNSADRVFHGWKRRRGE